MKKSLIAIIDGPVVKPVLLGLFPLVVGALCSFIGICERGSTWFYLLCIVVALLGIVFVILIAHYSRTEINDKKIAEIYKAQNLTYEQVMGSLMTLCKLNAVGANKVIKSIVKSSKANLELWDFDAACFGVCRNVYNTLCKIGKGTDFEVIYDRLSEETKPEIFIYANSYANKNNTKPSLLLTKRNINDTKFHDAELFRKQQTDIEVIIGSDEIDKVFDHSTREKRNENKGKYNQYIAVPVYCNDTKMIGLIEITCLNNTSLGTSVDEIKDLVSKYLMTYCFFILLLHKLEKALIAQPQK